MDGMSWRARLANSNINLLDIHDNMVFLEFTYHPKTGVFKWCKTVFPFKPGTKVEDLAMALESEVLSIRKELEKEK